MDSSPKQRNYSINEKFERSLLYFPYYDDRTKPTPATRPNNDIMVELADVRADDTGEPVGLEVEYELGISLGFSFSSVVEDVATENLAVGNNDGYDDGFGCKVMVFK